MTDTPWLTVKQATQRAQCGRMTIYNAIDAGQLKATKVGVRWLVHVEWLDAWLDAAATVTNQDAPGPALAYQPRRER